MIFIDLTQRLNDYASIYPGDPTFKICAHSTTAKDGYSVQSLSLGSHTGTHVDAPSHFFSDGKSIDEIPLSSFSGPALVINISQKKARERITWEEDVRSYSERIDPHSVILFRTDWSKHWGTPEYLNHPFLDRTAVAELLRIGVTRIGIDTLSPDKTNGPDEDFSTHELVLEAGGLIIENLCNLEALPEVEGKSTTTINFAPLLLDGGDGSPVRAYACVSD